MPLRFTKMHGLGNDYIYVSLFGQTLENPEELARVMSDRHRGIGGDGLILVAPPEDASADVRMIVYNADGSRARMCGNGIRCVAKLAFDRDLAPVTPMRVATDSGVLTVELTVGADGRVTQARVDMGEPALDPRKIPVAVSGERVVRHPILIEGTTLSMTCVSTGSAHAVFFEDDLARVPLHSWGPQLETHPLFPDRINVHFAQVVRRDLIGVVSWERGSGITRACGTGASAVCVAAVLNDLADRSVTVRMSGGPLQIDWDAVTNHVFMTGPAEEVFTGEWGNV